MPAPDPRMSVKLALISRTFRTSASKRDDTFGMFQDVREWRATFYATGMEHSPTSATGTEWERTP
jgi:hypothetical protein